jgi:hypothetical protein
MHALLLEIVQANNHLHLRAAQAIELADHQLITSLQRGQRGLQLRPVFVRHAGADPF